MHTRYRLKPQQVSRDNGDCIYIIMRENLSACLARAAGEPKGKLDISNFRLCNYCVQWGAKNIRQPLPYRLLLAKLN